MLLVAYAASGSAVDFFAFDVAGNVWNGSAFVAPPAAGTSPVAFRIAAVEGPPGRYTATAPAGTYGYDLRTRAGTWAASTPLWAEVGANVVAVAGRDADTAAVRDVSVIQRNVTVRDN